MFKVNAFRETQQRTNTKKQAKESMRTYLRRRLRPQPTNEANRAVQGRTLIRT